VACSASPNAAANERRPTLCGQR